MELIQGLRSFTISEFINIFTGFPIQKYELNSFTQNEFYILVNNFLTQKKLVLCSDKTYYDQIQAINDTD